MSYASVASHNIPFGEMPQPDQSLADGHFEGETSAHADVDHKINILPAGMDPEHPKITHEAPHHPEPITLNIGRSSEEPHTSSVAPKPTPAPAKGSGTTWEKKEKELEHDSEKAAKTAEKKGEEVEEEVKEGVAKAEKKGKEIAEEVKEGAAKAEEKGKQLADDVSKRTKEVADDVSKKTKEVANDVSKKTKEVADDVSKKTKEVADDVSKKSKQYARKARAELDEAESKLGPYWDKTKDVVLRPGTLGGLMGVVNVGILSTMGYFAYTRRDQPWDRRLVGGAVAGTLALFSAEGYVTDSYLKTDEGQAEAERAKREGSKLYLEAKERILRPQVAGGLVGAVNVAVLGTVGYFAYQNWNRPWDRNVVSAVTVGLLGLSGLEGWAGKEYKEKELPKRK